MEVQDQKRFVALLKNYALDIGKKEAFKRKFPEAKVSKKRKVSFYKQSGLEFRLTCFEMAHTRNGTWHLLACKKCALCFIS